MDMSEIASEGATFLAMLGEQINMAATLKQTGKQMNLEKAEAENVKVQDVKTNNVVISAPLMKTLTANIASDETAQKNSDFKKEIRAEIAIDALDCVTIFSVCVVVTGARPNRKAVIAVQISNEAGEVITQKGREITTATTENLFQKEVFSFALPNDKCDNIEHYYITAVANYIN